MTAIPDRAPRISLSGQAAKQCARDHDAELSLEDDYGVVSAEAVFERKQDGRRALYEPPRLPLDLPAGAGGLGEGRATLDLADSPYGGREGR